MAIDQDCAGLVHADDFYRDAMASQFIDYGFKRPDGGYVPQVRGGQINPHAVCRVAQVKVVGEDVGAGKKIWPDTA